MTKTTRINTEMRYINNRQQFTISELMAAFKISRSTAARDLAVIQELGMPLISSVGPDGGFTVMRNQLLPAVQFNTDELKALFVSFMATTNTQLPFLKNRQTLSEKLLAIASQTQQDDLVELKQLLRFENTNPANADLLELTDIASPLLKTVLNASLVSRHLTLTLVDATTIDSYVQYLYQQTGQWWVVIWDLTAQQTHRLALARLQTVALNPQPLAIKTIQQQIQAAQPAPNLKLRLGLTAIQQFKRQHRPNRGLQYLDPFEQTAQYEDYVDVTDATAVTQAVNWLLYLGPAVTALALPQPLRLEMQQRLQQWQ
ncbi:helix-turn-helix transcriptional regulator [Lactiplantibacillus daowaiensis]|uniref:Helix-turn-helix transcriptional regulator n=1 Tax=Lactiplantibacillus daowaiensis TaxID=2559918 RepID=A0ABW1S1H4_9LACO|nr:HTH domain-containing protein [Lactiplantibacillus daowaiensis]